MSLSTATLLIPAAMVALLYLVLLTLALKARRQYRRKSSAEAERVEEERDL